MTRQRQWSESEEDTPAALTIEPIEAYFNDLDCNDSAKNDDEWELNENVTFDYSLYFDDVPDFVDTSSLLSHTFINDGMHANEDKKEFVLVIPSYRKDQLPIFFGKV